MDLKSYRYEKGKDPALDAEFANTQAFGKVRPGETELFWKSGLRWYHIPYAKTHRIFRRIQAVVGRLCAGGRNFDIEYLVLLLEDDQELEIHIGDDEKKKAEALLEHLKQVRPEIPYGRI